MHASKQKILLLIIITYLLSNFAGKLRHERNLISRIRITQVTNVSADMFRSNCDLFVNDTFSFCVGIVSLIYYYREFN